MTSIDAGEEEGEGEKEGEGVGYGYAGRLGDSGETDAGGQGTGASSALGKTRAECVRGHIQGRGPSECAHTSGHSLHAHAHTRARAGSGGEGESEEGGEEEGGEKFVGGEALHLLTSRMGLALDPNLRSPLKPLTLHPTP
jgi:hypothetical protein